MMATMFEQQILQPLREQIQANGDGNAFCIDEKFYTYADLGRQISKIRTALRRFPAGNIGLAAHDDIETYAAIFAVWLEGSAYIPLHPNQPKERNEEIISQANISLVLDSKENIFSGAKETICTSSLVFNEMDLSPNAVSDEALAYILFTSGSTGKPKGVSISRKNVAAFMESFWKTGIFLDKNDKCLQCFDLTFDVSVQSFLCPLTRGACTYTIPHNQIKYSYVFGLLDDHQLTFGAMAPSMIRYLRPYFDEIDLPGMRYAILTAEASPLDLVTEWARCLPNAEIYDFYGPTEATIYCTYYRVPKDGSCKQLNGMLSIGKPMPGINALIIDDNGQIKAKNQTGEMVISGLQLTSGYWENPEKNREAFFEMQINGQNGRFYKTGDLCYIDDDGDIMYAGRLDSQVKVQGYRVELGEIEHHARIFLNGHNAVALPFENRNQNTEIALFIEGRFDDIDGLTAYLKSKIPSYMIPAKFVVEEHFPHNASDKVDRKKLKSLLDNGNQI